MDLYQILKNVDFVERYKRICSKYNDFENGMRGNNKKLYEALLAKLGKSYKYYANGNFFKIGSNDTNLHLVLKDGLVEPLLYVMKEGSSLRPKGRFDGIAEELEENFREKYTIPKYTSEMELEAILREIILLYEDIKQQVESES